MKKAVLVLSMAMLLLISGMSIANAQEQPAPKKDTVNMDTDAKPEFYYAIEDDKTDASGSKKGGLPLLPIIGGVVVIGGIAAFFILKKKK